MKTIDVTQLCNPLRVALKHSAIAIAVALIASSGTACATIINSFTGGIANVSGYYSSPGNAQYNAGTEGFTPHVSGSWTGSLDVDYGPPLYFFNNTKFTLTADPGFTVTLQDFDCGQYSGTGLSSFTVLDSGDNVLATVSDVATGSMEDFAWPALTDTKLTIVFASTQEDYTWINNIKFSEQATLLQVVLTSPADSQGYLTGSSITATATVAEPGAFTDIVTFHTTPIDSGGPTVDTSSTDLSSPFSADLGALPDGTYEIYATVANNDVPPGTATSATRTFTVGAAIPTTTTLATSGTPTTYGQNVTFTATVSPVPTGGTVQFYDGVDPLGTPVVNTSTGEAIFSSTTLGAGTHEITAIYSGHDRHEASPVSDQLSQVVDRVPLTVRASNAFRGPNTANPDPFLYQITGYQNGQTFATSGVTGTPTLTTDAILSSPVGDYVITCSLGSLVSSNYSFTLENGTLTIAEVADTFSVNFYVGPDWPFGGLTTDEQKANLLVGTGVPAGLGDWFTSGWRNFLVPWAPDAPLAPVTLTSNQASTATFTFKDCRNGWTYNGPRTTLLGDGNGNMMDGHVNSTLDPGDGSNLFDMEVTGIPFAVYDVIFYIGANLDQFGDGTGVIVFNGGAERAFTLKPGAFDGTFTEMVDATTQGNYIVFKNVTGASFTTKTWGTGPTGFNHIGPNGFQIREAAPLPGYAAWAASNAPGQTPGQDFDNDGVDNGLEYFMGQTGSSFTAMPGLDATNKVTWPKDPAYNGTWQVQTSPDLVAWTNVAGTDNGTSVSYTLPTGLGTAFVRLLATPTP